MEEYVDDSLGEVRLYSGLLTGFAVVALILAVTGIYGLMVFIVGHRTRELAIRRALGASTRDLLSTVLQPALAVIGVGTAAGTLAALSLTRFLQHLLYGVAGTDASSLVAVVLLLAGTGLAAAWIPAAKVARVEPMTVLRSSPTGPRTGGIHPEKTGAFPGRWPSNHCSATERGRRRGD